MNTLEPLCTGEQTEMLQKLGLNVLIDPTISLAKNWLYDRFGIWIETKVYKTGFWCEVWDKKLDSCLGSSNNPNPHTAESDCLTEVLKKLTNEKSNS